MFKYDIKIGTKVTVQFFFEIKIIRMDLKKKPLEYSSKKFKRKNLRTIFVLNDQVRINNPKIFQRFQFDKQLDLKIIESTDYLQLITSQLFFIYFDQICLKDVLLAISFIPRLRIRSYIKFINDQRTVSDNLNHCQHFNASIVYKVKSQIKHLQIRPNQGRLQSQTQQLDIVVRQEASLASKIIKFELELNRQKNELKKFKNVLQQTKKRWTSKEQSTILEAIEQQGFNWKLIAKLVPGRTPRQIEQHYNFCLRPDINKSEWTLEQDLKLVNLLQVHGTNWKQLQQQIKGRSQNQIKNRYFGRLLKISTEKQKLAASQTNIDHCQA